MDYVISYAEDLYLSKFELDETFHMRVVLTEWTDRLDYALRLSPDYAINLVDEIALCRKLDIDKLCAFCPACDV